MAWSSKTGLPQLTNITTEQFFAAVSLNSGELAHCEVEIEFPATPTDEAQINLYGTLDDSTENWDDTPIWSQNIANSPDPNKISFPVSGLYKFRVGVARSGSTDTLTSADMSYRKDGVSL